MEAAEDIAEIKGGADGAARDGRRPARRVARACIPTTRSSSRSTSAVSTSSTSTAAQRSVSEPAMRLTLLDGSSFVVCDERGDLGGDAAASGFFAADTRFLSRSVLTIDGERGEPVSFEQGAPHVGVFDLRWPSGLEVRRELFVGGGLEETVTVVESLRSRGGSGARARARLRLRRHLRGQARRGPWRAERLGGRAVTAGALERTQAPSSSRTTASPRARSSISHPRRTSTDGAQRDAAGCGSLPASNGSSCVAVQWLLNGTPELDAAAFAERLPRGPARA